MPNLTQEDLQRAADRLKVGIPEVKTVLKVESRGKGFDEKGRPVILFERHWFYRFTGGRYANTHPDICNKKPGGYGKSSEQYDRFSRAFRLDSDAAMKSASWGLGQVMGFNHRIVGYQGVGEFVDAMKESEGKQLDAFVEFILHNGIDDELRRHDWKGFARKYNGPNYEINDYDGKLAAAYEEFSA